MLAAAAVLLLLVSSSGSSPSRRNAAADAVADRSLVLGIDFNEKDPKAAHPDAADAKAFNAAQFGAWLDAQIQSPDDALESPPVALREYLRDRDAAVWSVVEALEKGAPEWESDFPKGEDRGPLLQIIRLQKLLLATALIEEQQGDAAQASRALEASWSLSRCFALGRWMIHQLLALAVDKWQGGALRKIRDPGLQWHGRLASDEAWERMLDATAADFSRGDDPSDDWSEISRKALSAVVEHARKASRCDVLTMSEEELWRPAAAALAAESSDERRQIRDFIQQVALPNVLNAIRRSARLSIDRELTLHVLELRLSRSGSSDGAWPESLVNAYSTACPGTTYEYRSDKNGMTLRFPDAAPAPAMGSVLPLEFHSQDRRPSPTPTPTPTPAP
jgi:hypothetical protein